MVGVARAWVQANKIEQGRVEKGGGLTSFPGFLFFPPDGAKRGAGRREILRSRLE